MRIPNMRVSKWGNGLAVRLPASVVDGLGFKEGDEIEIEIARDRQFKVDNDRRRDQALERLRKSAWPAPPGFRFSREDVEDS